MQVPFEVCLLIIFHVFGVFLFVFVYFAAGAFVSPLLFPLMRKPSRFSSRDLKV